MKRLLLNLSGLVLYALACGAYVAAWGAFLGAPLR